MTRESRTDAGGTGGQPAASTSEARRPAGEASPGRAGCCPLPAGVAPLPEPAAPQMDAERLASAAKALSDPIRIRMLEQMTAAQCCRGPAAGDAQAPEGVCVCEIQSAYGLAQSKVSYHLKVLREAGLIRETRRGKWSFYAVDIERARAALTDLSDLFGLGR